MKKLTKEQILEGNKLIWNFMGKPDLGFIPTHISDFKYLIYHSSWDWIMSVVEKIEASSGNFVICLNTCEINAGKFDCYLIEADSKIEAVWLSVVEFIKWHNENGK